MIRSRFALPILLLLVVAAIAHAGDPPATIPAVFSSATLADSIEKSKSSKAVVVADFTAEWCAPCKAMERTVWRDPRVEKWFKNHQAAVMRIDTDKEPGLRTEYAISAWPTLIGFKGGELVDRRLGSMNTEQLLTWLDKVETGNPPEPVFETVVVPANAGDGSGASSFSDRAEAASSLVESKKYEKATSEFLWLWGNVPKPEPGEPGFRRMILMDDMKRLATAHAPAKIAFGAERDRIEGVLKGDQRTFDDLDAWLILNEVVGDDQRTLAWFDRVKSEADIAPTFDHARILLEPVLERHERWAGMVRLIPDTIAGLRHYHDLFTRGPVTPGADEAMKASITRTYQSLFRSKAAELYVGLLALDRDTDAAKLVAEAVTLDDTPAMRIALVEKAASAKLPRKAQLDLLDQAEKAGADVKELRKRVLAAPK